MKVIITDKVILANPLMDFAADTEYEVVKTWNAGTEHREQMYIVKDSFDEQWEISEDECTEVAETKELTPLAKCIAKGLHLTDCSDDGDCTYCGINPDKNLN